jgi:hypothetical protein
MNQNEPQERTDLRERLQPNGRGAYSLTVPYPDKGSAYAIAWKLPSGETFSTQAHKFHQAARTNGNKLMEAFRQGLKGTPLDAISSLSLYVPVLEEEKRGSSMVIERVGVSVGGPQAPQGESPHSPHLSAISMQNNVYTQAWWEDTQLYVADSAQHLSAEERAAGFVPGEYALVTMPVVYGGDGPGSPPWGIVRVATSYNVLYDEQIDKVSNYILDRLLDTLSWFRCWFRAFEGNSAGEELAPGQKAGSRREAAQASPRERRVMVGWSHGRVPCPPLVGQGERTRHDGASVVPQEGACQGSGGTPPAQPAGMATRT